MIVKNTSWRMSLFSMAFTVSAVLVCLPALVYAQEKFTLRALSSWPKTAYQTQNFLVFAEALQKDADRRFPGQLRIDFRGGPEVIHHLKQVEAVRGGLIDLVVTAASYYTSIMPEMDTLSLTTFMPWEEREIGATDLLQKLHHKRARVHYLGRLGSGMYFNFFFSKPVQRIDEFKGLRIRGSPTHVPLIRALGAEPVVTSPAEIYTAMERGMIVGYVQPAIAIRDIGLMPVTRFMLQPGFYQPINPVLMNLDFWHKLPRHLQELLTEHIQRAEKIAMEANRKRLLEEMEAFRKAGITVFDLPPAEMARFSRMAADAMMEAVLKRAPEEGAALRDLVIKK